MSRFDLNGLLKSLQVKVKKIKEKRSTKTVAIFDLSGSTPMKLIEGHTLGTRIALLHNLICRKIVTNYDGIIIKELVSFRFDQLSVSQRVCNISVTEEVHDMENVFRSVVFHRGFPMSERVEMDLHYPWNLPNGTRNKPNFNS